MPRKKKDDPGDPFLMNIVYKRERQSHRQDKTFEFFYEQCKRRVSCRVDLGQSECIYIVPGYATGMPIYDPDVVAKKLYKKFTRDGFLTKLMNSNMLYLNWSQAGLEQADKALRKKKSAEARDEVSKQKKETKRLKKKWGLCD